MSTYHHFILPKKLVLLLLALLSFSAGYGQVRGVILNKETGKPLPYANIWVENEQIGTSSEEDGSFRLDIDRKAYARKNLVISCMGFEKLRKPISDTLTNIELSPMSFQLNEVSLSAASKKKSLTKTIGSINLNKINRIHGTYMPVIMAHFFPYLPGYKETPFLQQVSFVTVSDIEGAQLQVRVFGVTPSGEPGDDLTDPIVCLLEKGKIYTTADFSNENIRMPESGFFIGCEWLMIEKNKKWTTRETYINEKPEKVEDYQYMPWVATTPAGKRSVNRIYFSGEWKTTMERNVGRKVEKNSPVDEVLFQLVLSN